MSIETSHVEGLGRVTLADPPLNIFTRSMLAQLREGLAELAAESSLRAVLLTATGKHFSAGADVREHLPPTYRELIPEFLDTVLAIATFPLPVVAAVQGRCLGGGFEVAMSADLIVAAEGASFGQPEILLGVLPPAACALLPLQCGRGVAAGIVYTGDTLSSADAMRAGIVQQVVPDDQLEEAALQLAGRITRHSGATLREAKRMLAGGNEAALREALTRAGRIYTEQLMETRDAVEGLQSFMEKRRPTWSHR
jgi:cyclohexa-1,5-dienecarbonyl-CoA hydratase